MYTDSTIIDAEVVSRAIEMVQKERYLKKHPYTIYEGKNNKWYTYLPDETKKTKRRQIQRKSKEEIEKTVIAYYKDLEENPSFEEVYYEWIIRRADLNKISQATKTRYQHDYDRFFKEFGKRKVRKLTPGIVSDFLEEQIIKFNLTSKGFCNLKLIVRGVLKRAKKRGFIFFDIDPIFKDLDVSDREFKKRVIDDSKEIFYDDECERIVEYCRENRDISSLGVLLMFVSGLRVGEVVTLKENDILDGEVFVHRTETQYQKDNKNIFEVSERPKTHAGVRRVIIPDSYLWLLDILRGDGRDEYIFTGTKGQRLHTNQIRSRMYQICRKLDIPVRSPHKARKTYGTILLDNKVDHKFIEKQMGHTDISTTEAHYHRDRRRTQQKRDLINSIAEFS